MLNQIKYRENYVVDSYVDEWAAIGRADLPTFNPCPQPSTSDSINVFCQGDIWDADEFPSISSPNSSNADVIADSFVRHGVDFVKHVKGQFTSAIWDSKEQRLFLVNDRFGKHQLYLWMPSPETLFFACEVKCIIPIAKNSLRLNLQAVSDFLQYQFLIGDETYFENVSLLPQASILKFDRTGIRTEKYWVPIPEPEDDWQFSEEDYRIKLHELLSTAVPRAIHGRKAGQLLSGGLDTRNIAAHFSRRLETPHAFTYGNPRSDDVRLAQRFATETGYKFHFRPATYKIIPDFAALSAWILEGNATLVTAQNMLMLDDAESNAVEVVLDGITGNPVFGLSIPYSLPVFALLSLPFLGSIVLRLLRKSFPEEECYRRIRSSITTALKEDQVLDILSDTARTSIAFDGSLLNVIREAASRCKSILDIDYSVGITEYTRRYLVNTQNVCRWRVELIDPFLDYDLVDFTLKLPHKYKLWRRLVLNEVATFHPSNTPLERSVRPTSSYNIRLFLIMIAKRTPLIKNLIVRERPKPMGDLPAIVKENRAFFENILLDERARSRGIFKVDEIKTLIVEQMSSKADHIRLLLRLLSLELWFRSVEDRYGVKTFVLQGK